MSWIRDVKHEIDKLDFSRKSLKKFGTTVGAISIIIGLWLNYSNLLNVLSFGLFSIGLLLFLLGIILPKILRNPYLYWMTGAFVLGWFVSRFLLSIIFFFLITPLGLLAKLFKKKFMNIEFNSKNSYWIKKDLPKINYDKMY